MSWFFRQADAYRHGGDRPLGGYVQTMAIYLSGTLAAAGLARALGREVPRRVDVYDTVLLTVATHRAARTVAKDPVTSPLRAPLTSYAGTGAPGELAEEVCGHGLQHSLGELVSCPMCLAQWVATGFTAGLVLAPRATRLVLTTFTAVAGADFLQHLYAILEQKSE